MNPRNSFDLDLAPPDEEPEDELAAHAMHVVGDDDDDEDEDEDDKLIEKTPEDGDDSEEKVLDGLAELEEMAKKQLENPEDSPIKGDYDE